MTTNIKTLVVVLAVLCVPAASYAAARHHRGDQSNEYGYSNPGSCLGGACTGENPDRVRQPCSGGSCYKRTQTRHKKSSSVQ